MRKKSTHCISCGVSKEDRPLRGRYCHPCDYQRNKLLYKLRSEKRKREGYYKGKNSSKYKYYTKARNYYGEVC